MSWIKLNSDTATHWLWLVPPIVAADQLSKWLVVEHLELFSRIEVLPVFGITYLQNRGAAFSFLSSASGWQRWMFIALGIVVTLIITAWLRRLPEKGHGLLAAGLSMVAAGALGNVLDRVWHGYVIDFLSFHYENWFFPAFNVADSAITVGAILLIVDSLLEKRRKNQVEA